MTHTATRRLTQAALTAAVVAGSALLSGCDSPPDTIKIGVAQPLSGNLAALGQDLHNGVKMAVDELNKEGFQIKGKTIGVLSGSTGEKWVNDNKAANGFGDEIGRASCRERV